MLLKGYFLLQNSFVNAKDPVIRTINRPKNQADTREAANERDKKKEVGDARVFLCFLLPAQS